jgi:adenylosuccinate synthase
MIQYADIIVDLQAGDTGKGKVANHLTEQNDYTHIIRYNGGGNAGHTFYHNNNKIVTHHIPVGIIHNKKSVIGPGCVIDTKKLLEEIDYLENMGYTVKDKLLIDKRVHIVKQEYIDEETNETTIGTTKTGTGPTYRNKYDRKGLRAENCEELSPYIIDIYDELHGKDHVRILFEGAQGFELDIDWGDYPYVTSSHCTVGGALNNGVPHQRIVDIYGVAKAYRTYVGSKKFEPEDKIFDYIRNKFGEFGSTTGRPRQLNWLDVNMLIKAININGVTKLIINKFDVLKEINVFKLIEDNIEMSFNSEFEFTKYLQKKLYYSCQTLYSIKFSETPHKI